MKSIQIKIPERVYEYLSAKSTTSVEVLASSMVEKVVCEMEEAEKEAV